jgi:GxxExxY protein
MKLSRPRTAHQGFTIERQKPLPVTYRGEVLDLGYRIDLLVEHSVIVEIKSVERFHPIHGAQLVSYLRHSRCKVGLVLNFNVNGSSKMALCEE